MKYPKINTLFKRDENNIIIPTEYTLPEFKSLELIKWECTEKIDGTNIRIELIPNESQERYLVKIKGRTDNANIPERLLKKLQSIFTEDLVNEVFPECNSEITIFGEGYGQKIQSGHNYISNDVDFILFDVKVGKWWLQRPILEQISEQLNVKIVPLIGFMTISKAIEFVKNGFKSTISQNKDYDAEGLVLKTPDGLLLRSGERLITKIKTCDFKKLKSI